MSNFDLEKLINSFPKLKRIEEKLIESILPKRNETFSKRDFGHALLIAGGESKAGAAILMTKSCLRSGAGLTSTHIPDSCRIAMNISCPEAMLSLDENGKFISQIPDIKFKTAVGIGPGIGFETETIQVVEGILQTVLPKVIDADALTILSQNAPYYQCLNPNVILTPHEREFDRLTKVHDTWEERITSAINFVSNYHCILVLKAPNTLIFAPNELYYNTTGNIGLAKGGSGDVLTGIITSYLAQGIKPLEAAIAAVYNHGKAADLAVENTNSRALIASDVINSLRFI